MRSNAIIKDYEMILNIKCFQQSYILYSITERASSRDFFYYLKCCFWWFHQRFPKDTQFNLSIGIFSVKTATICVPSIQTLWNSLVLNKSPLQKSDVCHSLPLILLNTSNCTRKSQIPECHPRSRRRSTCQPVWRARRERVMHRSALKKGFIFPFHLGKIHSHYSSGQDRITSLSPVATALLADATRRKWNIIWSIIKCVNFQITEDEQSFISFCQGRVEVVQGKISLFMFLL